MGVMIWVGHNPVARECGSQMWRAVDNTVA